MAKNKILIVYGSRPEYLKVKPLIGRLAADALHIGQHTNIIDFGEPDHFISVEKEGEEGRLAKIGSEILLKLPQIIRNYESIIIQGDTASIFYSSIIAYQEKKKLIYLESGLRSDDIYSPFPEEGYRRAVSELANVNLCPTEYSAYRLRKQGVLGEIHIVGNTVLDNLVGIESFYGDKVLVTIHRNENLARIDDILKEIDRAAGEHPGLEFVFPVHPNPVIQKAAAEMRNVKTCKPLEHNELLEIMRGCRFLLGDSGGIAEESSWFSKKYIMVRDTTERVEGVMSGHFTLCPINKIQKEISWHAKGKNHEIFVPCPFGDGFAADKIKNILENV